MEAEAEPIVELADHQRCLATCFDPRIKPLIVENVY